MSYSDFLHLTLNKLEECHRTVQQLRNEWPVALSHF
ncbi:hypothetical protein T08_6644 [Trichinella sp. T8]|nr:hypothetical protein T08_5827 [Trichinella sp. T8]KRZ82024.1 hypothetical protein T08_6644 [Trichinella sp. T8]